MSHKALHHLKQAQDAVKSGDHSKGRHHIGHALAALRVRQQAAQDAETDGAVADQAAPSSPAAASPASGFLDRLRAMNAMRKSS